MKAIISILLLGPLYIFAQKPILPGFQADPSVHQWDGKYWIYPSHDIPGSTGWNMQDWHCFSSADLVQWKDHGVIFSLVDVTWADKKAYAPDIMKHNNRYYFFFPADYQIGVAVSGNPDGPFHDALGHPLISRKEAGIEAMDPMVFVDDDSSVYLYYGGHSSAGVVRLANDMISRNGPIERLDLYGFSEGLWVHKYHGNYYFSYPMQKKKGGKVSQDLVYSVSESPTGPFKYEGLIMESPYRNIQHSIVEIMGRWYLFYHVEGNSPYERKVCAEYLHYDERGNIIPVEMTLEGIKALE